MATIHITEAEAARDFGTLLAKVRGGDEVMIDGGTQMVIMRSLEMPRRTIEECIALLPEDSEGVVDEDFAADVQAGIDGHREPFDPPAWD